ncbi:30S ribosomal protein S21 [Candidatus Roizmanbacteria bacterium CG02_land_8_20_14_3_00_36_15]|uniref:Small ribosomal subunit protein bS21 n=2 Tax=Candidatus Roizmaniibacteriota TaxID=1752723 RepID=A0A2M8KKW1_9BACT|nr:MAG: 30S ribosomal protein S21 [Candidatus Roizmanbacteria bacterium CG03_land_8_20_14_0_80_36_21]PIV37994.1 MAG: 30S ribosomal protein S21 [Candidatus Roizmanbacteria bacterium CG02_land_8_20_14_3_00_36_15]PIY70130.1 MAG: 30S ribosomal protein S21 [Candidatus Roizmanbacteria bacterium CG_4_10_14_0_8_um_filter_36_36]PJA52822.1 MAG: 30S ribosomal protein S21 [Candidatus Roizmanbacteria bacterium CG_4_9_14_3_um_filter_36_11]PJC81220.1 MAG: 30S ribosomal protein S21 [Candidatus Roizmanbacteria 
MVFVRKKKGESKDSLFRKFTRSFIDEDIINDVRNKLFYKKPSLVRREEEKERTKPKTKRYGQYRLSRKI